MSNVVDLGAIRGRVQADAHQQGRIEGFADGFAGALEFVEQRVTDLLALSPEQRALYFMLADEGLGDGLPPIVVKLLRGEVKLDGS